ncbi:hypothetical protein I6F65_20810, partial [Pseudoalteromonas sp. SWXJZ94C]|nr:hypothetical protein [Pseudoalteromonas sp. SWXJZ94C]
MKALSKTALIVVISNALFACGSDNLDTTESTEQVVNESTESLQSTTVTQGANKLAENNSDNVWRFAVIPDTQGRDDDDYKQTITHTYDGITLSVDIGYDVNNDDIFDGEGWKIDVSDPYNAIFVDENGDPLVAGDLPVEIASSERADTPYDFKHLPA